MQFVNVICEGYDFSKDDLIRIKEELSKDFEVNRDYLRLELSKYQKILEFKGFDNKTIAITKVEVTFSNFTLEEVCVLNERLLGKSKVSEAKQETKHEKLYIPYKDI